MKIVKSQSGDFARAKGKEVMEAFLKSPDGKKITALFAHNDDMALGAFRPWKIWDDSLARGGPARGSGARACGSKAGY